MITHTAYLQMRKAIETARASLANLEEHFARFHACAAPEELEQARVKVQDLYSQVAILQQRLNRCGDARAAEDLTAL
jgi:hypothetical protein